MQNSAVKTRPVQEHSNKHMTMGNMAIISVHENTHLSHRAVTGLK